MGEKSSKRKRNRLRQVPFQRLTNSNFASRALPQSKLIDSRLPLSQKKLGNPIKLKVAKKQLMI